MILVMMDCDDVEALYETDKTRTETIQAFWEKYPQKVFVQGKWAKMSHFRGGRPSSTTYPKDLPVGYVTKDTGRFGLKVVNASEVNWNIIRFPQELDKKLRDFVYETCTSISFDYI